MFFNHSKGSSWRCFPTGNWLKFQLFWAARCRLKIPKVKIKQRHLRICLLCTQTFLFHHWNVFLLHCNGCVFFLQNFLSNEPILLTQGMSRDQSQLIIANKPNKCLQALFLRQSSEQRRIHDAVFQSNEEVFVFGGLCAFKSQRFTQQKQQERISWVQVFLCGDNFLLKENTKKLRQVSSQICGGIECHLGGGFKCVLFSSLFWEKIYIIY